MKLAMAQMKNEGSMEANLEKSLALIKEAARNQADLILFPEVHLTDFFAQYQEQDVREYGVEIDSKVIRAFQDACCENHIMAVPNIYLLQNDAYYDASLLIDKKGGILGIQKMIHVAEAPQFYEQDYYTPSDDGFHVFDTEFGKIGLVICFDRHYPESIRTEALMGADLILIPTVNVKTEPSEKFKWEILIQAFQNSVPIAMCNRVGKEGEMDFSGESLVSDANGELLLMADDDEKLLFCEVRPELSGKIRSSRPYTSLRRKEFYI
ncbi:MAG: carbon-nitrogen hydrolase family protein [Lachnospiraceae bacterium]|nr:carbon-nitrogen hydrolase family protein [Lachnospiraceae bacterium]